MIGVPPLAQLVARSRAIGTHDNAHNKRAATPRFPETSKGTE